MMIAERNGLARGGTASDVNRWLVLAVMSLSVFMVFVDGSVVNTALPAIARDLEASTATLQWVADGYILILAGLLLLGGTLGDKYGRRRALAGGMVVFALGSTGAALAANAESLILFRGVQGLGAALVLPATLSILTAVFPRHERSKAIGIWTGVGGLGVAFGPVVGGYLVDTIDWSAVFWLHLPVIAAALLGLQLVPESRDTRQLDLDAPGALLATIGLVALVFGIIQGNESGWASAEIIGAFLTATALLLTFALVELRARAPMLPLHLFRQSDLTGAVLIIGLLFFAMFGVFFFLTQFFQLVQGRSALDAGLLILPAALAMMISASVSGFLSQVVGPKILVTTSMVIIAGGMALLTEIETGSGIDLPISAIFLFGFGVGLGMAPLTDTVMAAVPVDDAGVGSAVNDVSRELGGALGVAALGAVVSGLYRSNVEDALTGTVPAELVEAAGDGIGVAVVALASLPPNVGASVERAADAAFVDALGDGLLVGVVFVAIAALLSALLIPWRMRAEQVSERRPEPVAATVPTSAVRGVSPISAPIAGVDATSWGGAADRIICRCFGRDFAPWCRCAG